MTNDAPPTARYVALDSLFIRAEERYVTRGAVVELPVMSGDILLARGAVAALPDKAKNGATVEAGGLTFRYTTKNGWEVYTPESDEDAPAEAEAPIILDPVHPPSPPSEEQP